jgi:hypothetical protein
MIKINFSARDIGAEARDCFNQIVAARGTGS